MLANGLHTGAVRKMKQSISICNQSPTKIIIY